MNEYKAATVPRPSGDTGKYVDLKRELSDLRDLMQQVLDTVPIQKEYVALRETLAEVAVLLQAQTETKALLRQLDVEWKAVTNRVFQSLEEAKKEKVEFKAAYVAVMEKELRLIEAVKQDICINEERFLHTIVEMSGHLTTIRAPSWSDRAKQYGLQLIISLGLMVTILGVYYLATLVVRFF